RSAMGGYGLGRGAASPGPASRMLIGPMSASAKLRPADSGGLVTWRTLACALWLRTNAISCVPGMLMSAMNMPCPWRCLASSLRSKLVPIQLAACSRSVILPGGYVYFRALLYAIAPVNGYVTVAPPVPDDRVIPIRPSDAAAVVFWRKQFPRFARSAR